ncbi:MAG: (d)CMP kinase [Planctomycetota bacterium]|jgi:cytidylate kinase
MPTDAADNHCPVIITIDGPAGTGKSTVAHLLARRLGVDFLDTGAMYRAAALVALEQEIDPDDGPALAAAVAGLDLHFDWRRDPPRIMVGDRDISRRIRDLDVAAIVSIVAAQAELRSVLVEQQRRIAADHPRLVTEGRDQGSVVFPDAGARFYLDADIEVRADRRARQLIEAGMDVDHERIVQGIIERDRIDSSRSDGPLIRPQGAVALDTSDLTAEQVVDELERLCREHFPDAGFTS